jgi:hypothetical protein
LNHLRSVDVEFNNSFSKSIGAEISFWVLKGGGTRGHEKSTTFGYTFSPIKKSDRQKARSVTDAAKLESEGQDLLEALSSLGTCLQQYKNDTYGLDEITLQVAFKVTKSVKAGAEFEIAVVGIGTEGEFGWEKENNITLTFSMK